MKKLSLKKVLLLSAGLLCFSQLNAQVKFGGGCVIHNLTETYNNTSQSYPKGGLYVEALYTTPQNIECGIRYEMVSGTLSGGGISYNWDETYINIPVIRHFAIGQEFYIGNTALSTFAYCGVTCSYCLSAEAKYNGVSMDMFSFFDEMSGVTGTYNRFDFMCSAGFIFNVGNTVSIDLGYDWGLLDRFTPSNTELKQNQMRLAIQMRF